MQWDEIDPAPLFAAIREQGPAADAERTVWAFEQLLAAARVDEELLRHLLVAAASLVAYDEGSTPRHVLEQIFRRAVSDGVWRRDFAPLLAS